MPNMNRRKPGEFRNLWNESNSRPLKEEMTMTLLQRLAATVDSMPVRKAPWHVARNTRRYRDRRINALA